MPQFSYKARRKSGELVTGVLEVNDRSAALSQVQRMGLFPIAIDSTSGPVGGNKKAAKGFSFSNLLPPALRELKGRQRKPSLQEIANYTQQLSNLIKSGMPLTVALNSMAHISSKGIPSSVSKQLKQDVVEGKSLSDAMARQGVVFSDMYVNMVRAGEQSGALTDVLNRLSEHFERFAEVQSKFTSAMVYPAFVALTGLVIVIIFVTKMLPTFLGIFQGMNIDLPMSTQILVHFSDFIRSPTNLLIMGLVAVAGFVLFLRFRGSEMGRRAIDGWKLEVPIVGKVFRMNLFAQFARTLATLLTNGVPVLTALKITEQVIPNVVLKEAIAKTREAVTDGKTIAQPLARSGIFPQLMIDLLKIGEDTGDVPGSLRNVADTYENQMNIALRVMTNLIEPVIIVVMALGVGFLLLSILEAMFKLTASIAQ